MAESDARADARAFLDSIGRGRSEKKDPTGINLSPSEWLKSEEGKNAKVQAMKRREQAEAEAAKLGQEKAVPGINTPIPPDLSKAHEDVNQQPGAVAAEEKKTHVTLEELYSYLRERHKLSQYHALGVARNAQAESAYEIGVVQGKVPKEQAGLGLFQVAMPDRRDSFIMQVPDWQSNWRGQVDFMMRDPRTMEYLAKKFQNSSQAASAFTHVIGEKWQDPKVLEKRARARGAEKDLERGFRRKLDIPKFTGEEEEYAHVRGQSGGRVKMHRKVYDAYDKMRKAALKDGIVLDVVSGIRDKEQQQKLYKTFLANVKKHGGKSWNPNAPKTTRDALLKKASAASVKAGKGEINLTSGGESRHMESKGGIALDISQHSKAGHGHGWKGYAARKWLLEHAEDYGFIQHPWARAKDKVHWEYEPDLIAGNRKKAAARAKAKAEAARKAKALETAKLLKTKPPATRMASK
tara:strand:+ start:1418 stop:2812 length:1395 start_codon:yes stop_codon:yes gene_type:complete